MHDFWDIHDKVYAPYGIVAIGVTLVFLIPPSILIWHNVSRKWSLLGIAFPIFTWHGIASYVYYPGLVNSDYVRSFLRFANGQLSKSGHVSALVRFIHHGEYLIIPTGAYYLLVPLVLMISAVFLAHRVLQDGPSRIFFILGAVSPVMVVFALFMGRDQLVLLLALNLSLLLIKSRTEILSYWELLAAWAILVMGSMLRLEFILLAILWCIVRANKITLRGIGKSAIFILSVLAIALPSEKTLMDYGEMAPFEALEWNSVVAVLDCNHACGLDLPAKVRVATSFIEREDIRQHYYSWAEAAENYRYTEEFPKHCYRADDEKYQLFRRKILSIVQAAILDKPFCIIAARLGVLVEHFVPQEEVFLFKDLARDPRFSDKFAAANAKPRSLGRTAQKILEALKNPLGWSYLLLYSPATYLLIILAYAAALKGKDRLCMATILVAMPLLGVVALLAPRVSAQYTIIVTGISFPVACYAIGGISHNDNFRNTISTSWSKLSRRTGAIRLQKKR